MLVYCNIQFENFFPKLYSGWKRWQKCQPCAILSSYHVDTEVLLTALFMPHSTTYCERGISSPLCWSPTIINSFSHSSVCTSWIFLFDFFFFFFFSVASLSHLFCAPGMQLEAQSLEEEQIRAAILVLHIGSEYDKDLPSSSNEYFLALLCRFKLRSPYVEKWVL